MFKTFMCFEDSKKAMLFFLLKNGANVGNLPKGIHLLSQMAPN